MVPETPGPVFNHVFADLDAAPRPAALVAHQDRLNAQALVQAYKHTAYALLALVPGAQVLEVGCGTGEDAWALADLVGPTGHVTGLDRSATMVAQARARRAERARPVAFLKGDARRLPFADATFDAARIDRVLHHLAAPARALDELVRVVRSGGRLVVSEPDFDTFVLDHPDEALTRRILRFFAAHAAQSGRVGRHLYAMFVERGLQDIAVVPIPVLLTDLALAEDVLWLGPTLARAQAAGVLSADEARTWRAALAAASGAGRFFAAGFGFTIAGRRP